MRTAAIIQAAMDAILAAADARPEDERSLTSEEVSSYEELEAELQAANRDEAIRARHRAYRTPVALPDLEPGQSQEDAELTAAFDAYLRTGQPNSDLTFSQTEGTPSAGGYAVPDTFLTRLTERRVAFGGLMNAAENITTADGRPISWPSVAPAVYTEADIAAEGAGTAAGADIVFGEVTLGAFKYVSAGGDSNAPLKVSVELLQDASFDVGAFVARRLGERIARKMAYDFCNGSGSGEPLGIAYGTAGTVEHDPDGFAAFSNLVHALDPAYRDNASWIFNDTTAKNMEQLLDGPSGTSGRPLLQPSTAGIDGGPGRSRYTLLGYPVIIDQAMPTWAADNVIGAGFGDWSQAYIIRHVRDVQVLVNPYAVEGYVVYSAWARADGTVQDAYAYVTGEGT